MRLPTRLAIIGLGVLGATLVLVAVVTYQIVRLTGRQSVDRALRDELTTVSTAFPALVDDQGEITRENLQRAAAQYLAVHPGTSRHLTVLVIGNDMYTTRSGPEALLELDEDGNLPSGRPGHITTEDTDEGPVRVLNAPLLAGGTTAGRAIIAGPLQDVYDDAADALVGIAVGGLIGLVFGGVALTLTTRRAVRPVVELAAAARDTGGGDLTARVPEPARRDEVGELAAEFNRMLERISADAEQRRRLLSAVSHELRTPLAVARGHLEMFEALDLAGPDAGADTGNAPAELTAVIRSELDRLTRLTDDLEAILQGDGATSIELGPVFLPDVFDELRQRLAGLGMTGVELREAPPVVVEADQHRIAQALLNLVSNAGTHTAAGTTVVVDAAVVDQQLNIGVTDNGAGIDPSIRDHIFEPFVTTRADGSTAGRGLGLAIVKSLIEAQRGTVDLVTGPSGTSATIRLPLAPVDDDSQPG